MSYYPNGYSQQNNTGNQGGGQYNSIYTISNTQQPPQRMIRRSSFEQGDDSPLFDQSQPQQQAQIGYGGYQHQTQPQTQSLPYRVPSIAGQSYAPGPYQHATSPATQASYNPAAYSAQQTATYTSPTAYGARPVSYAQPLPSSAASYTPYVPAAYATNPPAHTYNGYGSPITQGIYGTATMPTVSPRLPVPQSPAQAYTNQTSLGYSNSTSSRVSMSPPAPTPPLHSSGSFSQRPYSYMPSAGYDSLQPPYGGGYIDQMSNASNPNSSGIGLNVSDPSRQSHLSGNYSSSSQLPPSDLQSRQSSGYNTAQQPANMLERHPTGRRLPGLPSDSESDIERNDNGINDIVDQINRTIDASSTHLRDSRDPLFATNLPASSNMAVHYGAIESDSDPEAAAGIAAMQAAEEAERLEEQRRSSYRSSVGSGQQHGYSDQERSDDSDYAGAGFDISAASGGFAGTMHYGSHDYDTGHLDPQRMSSARSSNISSDGRNSNVGQYEHYTAFPTFPTGLAQVDAGGTGGLTAPRDRRMSYEDGDEKTLVDYPVEDDDNFGGLFFAPGHSPSRPLPPPPAHSDPVIPTQRYTSSFAADSRRSVYAQVPHLQPTAPGDFNSEALSPSTVPRSTSLASTRSAPRADPVVRSKTDADRAHLHKQQQGARAFSDVYDPSASRGEVGMLDLPTIPRKKFDAGKISPDTFKRCTEPWAMSSVLLWIKELTQEETDLKEATITEAISTLFAHKVPTMNTIEAESLGQQFVQDMFSSQVLLRDEEWVKFGYGTMSGVMYQLTGLGCYSQRLHVPPAPTKGRCYAHHCMRTVKKLSFSIAASPPEEVQWQKFYNMTQEQWESKGKKESERQFNLHEIVNGEVGYLYGLELVRTIYRDRLARSDPPILSPKRLPVFLKDVFGLVEKVRKVNEDFLIAQLKYRQQEQGPWIVGFSDIFREWIRRARPIYVDYAAKYPRADELIREESRKNPSFYNFLEEGRKASTSRLAWDNYLKSPIQRLQRYILLLQTVMKNTITDSDEKINLGYAIDELQAAAHESDVKVNETNKQLELQTYAKKMKLRKYQGDEVDLALDHLGRTVILKGDLQRQGDKGLSWVWSHVILFDHYLVLAKIIRDVHGTEYYDVSKPPIAMGLIQLESTNDPPVMKSTIRGVAAVDRPPARGVDPRLARTTSAASGAALVHTNSGFSGGSSLSGNTVGPAAILEGDTKEDKILYPFKVKHLGRSEVYTLYASTQEKRDEWCQAIISAKTAHAEALYTQNAEPFKLQVIADTAFSAENYQVGAQKRVIIRGTPLDRAIKEVVKRYADQGRPAPICRQSVNCATVFQQAGGVPKCAIGTDGGVFISDYGNPRGWVKSIAMPRVTQVSVLEEFNLMLILADKVLIAYHLDVVCPLSGPPIPQGDASARKAPQKLSGSKDVSFFLAGKMKDRMLVFYQKKNGINSIFKILEPVLQKSATSKSRWLGSTSRRGQTEFFREFDEFYIPTETYALNIFHSSLAVATKNGMETLTLDKKVTWEVPNLDGDATSSKQHLDLIRNRLRDLKPLGMFRLSDVEFLIAYSECAVYVNKLADVSRSVIMEFVGRANNACLFYPYLILFNDDFVEIRDAQNGRLKQVIAGKDIRMLDDGGNASGANGAAGGSATLGGGANGLGVQGFNSVPRTVKVSMQHPEYEKSCVVVELLLKDTNP